jgi:uncharacterized membrane protein YhaH (DUF805 family)
LHQILINNRINKRMDNRIKKIMNESKYTPDFNLSDSIWRNIESRKSKIYRLKSWIYSSLFFISLILLVPSINSLIEKSLEYGFSDYLSLVSYDFDIVLVYWREFSLSLINSIPVVSLILSLLLIFVSVLSLVLFSKNLRTNAKTA